MSLNCNKTYLLLMRLMLWWTSMGRSCVQNRRYSLQNIHQKRYLSSVAGQQIWQYAWYVICFLYVSASISSYVLYTKETCIELSSCSVQQICAQKFSLWSCQEIILRTHHFCTVTTAYFLPVSVEEGKIFLYPSLAISQYYSCWWNLWSVSAIFLTIGRDFSWSYKDVKTQRCLLTQLLGAVTQIGD